MLTERQQRFVDAYRGNGLEAARAAGYSGSDATLMVRASVLLKTPAVAQAIEERQARIAPPPAEPEAPELAPRHRAFVDAFLRLGSQAAAARETGYSASSAARLLARADVREAIEVARVAEEEKGIANAREQQEILTALARDVEVEAKDRIAAIRELHRIQRGNAPTTNPAAGSGPGAVEQAPPARRIVLVHNGRGPQAANG